MQIGDFQLVHRITGCRLTLTLALATMLTVLTAGCGQSTTLNVTPTTASTGAPTVVSAPDEAQPVTATPTVTPSSMTGPTPAVTGPAPGGSPVVSSGGAHTCLLTPDGELSYWGSNEVGESSPPSGESFSAVSAGGWHTCTIREDGVPVCWGAEDALLNDGQATPPADEIPVPVSSGGGHTCGVREDGSVVCWGANNAGQSSPPN